MKYNDNQIIGDHKSQELAQCYQQSEQLKVQDLLELYTKMQEQRDYMLDNNANHTLDNLIETTNNHLNSLDTIIKASGYTSKNSQQQYTKHNNISPMLSKTPTNQNRHSTTQARYSTMASSLPYAQPHLRPFIEAPVSQYPQNEISNNTGELPNTNNNVPSIDNNNPIPPLSPDNRNNLPNTNNNVPNTNNGNNTIVPPSMENSENIGTNPNNNLSPVPPSTNDNMEMPNNSNTNNNVSTPLPNNNSTRTKQTRNSPLQGSILSTIARAIFGKRIKQQNIITADNYRNRFHNTFVQTSKCNPHNKLITNECNILRLLLLYITLNPHCRFIRRLSEIAQERLRILTELM